MVTYKTWPGVLINLEQFHNFAAAISPMPRFFIEFFVRKEIRWELFPFFFLGKVHIWMTSSESSVSITSRNLHCKCSTPFKHGAVKWLNENLVIHDCCRGRRAGKGRGGGHFSLFIYLFSFVR